MRSCPPIFENSVRGSTPTPPPPPSAMTIFIFVCTATRRLISWLLVLNYFYLKSFKHLHNKPSTHWAFSRLWVLLIKRAYMHEWIDPQNATLVKNPECSRNSILHLFTINLILMPFSIFQVCSNFKGFMYWLHEKYIAATSKNCHFQYLIVSKCTAILTHFFPMHPFSTFWK